MPGGRKSREYACTVGAEITRQADRGALCSWTVLALYGRGDVPIDLSGVYLLSCHVSSLRAGMGGIVRRYTEEPPNTTGWRWSDQAQSFRPRTSRYDRDCGLVIDEFDHTCPWTGTGIGRDNMIYFQVFTSCVCGCLIFNIILMVKFGDTIEGL
mmetsp:Transcript_65513/g.112619  ORF Transcript_65513/g.112619 Transcript_65513/m.112619 type:complete len:154 (-) Transcript_65513:91-552(-)